jgi:CHASE2 domain-containing sensor protein
MEKEPEISSDFVLVNLDDASKLASGYKYIWPFEYYAKTIKKITDGEPTSFGIDILFTKSCDTSTWPLLIDELAASYQAINPYVVKFGDIKNPLEINAHRESP